MALGLRKSPKEQSDNTNLNIDKSGLLHLELWNCGGGYGTELYKLVGERKDFKQIDSGYWKKYLGQTFIWVSRPKIDFQMGSQGSLWLIQLLVSSEIQSIDTYS